VSKTSDVVVIGAGMIGTAVAWRCAQHGLSVALVDPDARRGAWQTAAGMLAPITEAHTTEATLLGLNLRALRGYRSFTDEVSAASGLPTGFRECGTVFAAWDAADLAALRDLHQFLSDSGLSAEMVTGRDLRALEPGLAPGLPGGLYAAGDHQVDPRLLHQALTAAGQGLGVTRVVASAQIVTDGDRITGVRAGSEYLSTATAVIAAGAWAGLLEGVRAPVRPVKGQTVRLRLPGGVGPQHVVRGSVKGSPVYVVPRGDGRLVVGASSEEAGFDVSPRAGAVYDLLRDAQSLLPELGEATLEEVCTGLRPGSPDNAPLMGPADLAGLHLATGHYRNGVLLADLTANAVAHGVLTGRLPDWAAAFTPARFSRAAAR
jgi:glycine oxidase